jgi:hypothetical protein
MTPSPFTLSLGPGERGLHRGIGVREGLLQCRHGFTGLCANGG